jgi:ribosomal protein S21
LSEDFGEQRTGGYRREGRSEGRGDSRRDGPADPRREFERAVRRLKKDFQKNVLPAVKRHSSYVSKSEMKRIKERKAARRRRRQLRKFGGD